MPRKPTSSTASAARWWTCWTVTRVKTVIPSFWIPRRRALPFSIPPRRSTSRRTLSASMIRPIRSRRQQPLRRSRQRQNPRKPRLSRPLPSPSDQLFSRCILNFAKTPPASSGAFFPLGGHPAFTPALVGVKRRSVVFRRSPHKVYAAFPADHPVRFLTRTALYHFGVALSRTEVLMWWCRSSRREHGINTRSPRRQAQFL